MPGNDNTINARIKLITALAMIAFIALGWYLYTVQILRHEELYTKAKKKYTSIRKSSGHRGEIYDYEGNLLVGNRPAYFVQLDPSLLNNENAHFLADLFSRYLDLDKKTLLKKFSLRTRQAYDKDGKLVVEKNRYAHVHSKVPLSMGQILREEIEKRNLLYKEENKEISKQRKILKKEKKIDALKKLKYKEMIRGVVFKIIRARYYPKENMLASVLGYTFIDENNQEKAFGLERHFFNEMSSENYVATYERSRKGRPLSYGNREVESKADKVAMSVFMTIREPIQSIVEEELDKLVAKWQPKAAWAILAAPDGNILAMAQRPTYNPNDRRDMTPESSANIIMRDNFEPGSTMKPIVISKAMDMGFVSPNTAFFCENGYWPQYKLRDSHPLGNLNVAGIIQKSSNIGTAKITLLMGEKNLFNTLHMFGFGKRSGIEIGLENTGILHPIRTGDGMTIARLPIGQAFNVTPLQLVRAYCALANHGKLPSMRIVDRLENKEENLVKVFKQPPPRQLYRNPNTWPRIIEMMKLVTQEGGTATQAAIKGFSVAGKTGTSQKIVNGAYSHSKYYASFIGFVPAEKAAFVLLVTADEPKRSHYGGTVAAPTFKNIAIRVLRHMNIKPTKPEELNDSE